MFLDINNFFLLFLIIKSLCFISINGFNNQDEGAYISSFENLIRDSYSHPLPSQLIAECKNQPSPGTNLAIKSISSSMSSSELQSFCGTNTICTIPAGFTVTMNSNLNVAALVVNGVFNWTDSSQTSPNQWLCSGYIVVRGGHFNMNIVSKTSYIYIKNNNQKDVKLSTRVFGATASGKIIVTGRNLKRTWSLLAKTASPGMSSISLLHNPKDMGWNIGDRVVIAPTEPLSRGTAEDYFIGEFQSNNTITLLNRNKLPASIRSTFISKSKAADDSNMIIQKQAEVINLSRNIVITGDDFEHLSCVRDEIGGGRPQDRDQSDHCSCWGNIGRTKCTAGLHIIGDGVGTVLSLQYTRVEKCGQRGILGKYCIHLHLIQKCKDCKVIGNAVEYGHQRGTVIHGTHLATIENNVYNDIRGGVIYVEDGNEMYNRIFHNVVVCPWPKDAEKRGCTIPGTDNDQADTGLNQAGIWGLSFTNYVIGNRFANNFNGMLYQEQGFPNGRGHVDGLECPSLQQIGRLEGNTFHGSGRFGTYFLSSTFPKKLDRNLERNGLPDKNTCKEWTSSGEDTGLPISIMNNVDYGNAFVGQYSSGDIQYRFHSSVDNLNLIYWKETKNFQDGCSSHIADSFYENGNLALPGGHGTFILENMTFSGQVHFESSHHCNIGVTGVLCMPTYVFTNMKWNGLISDELRIVQWGPNNGAMFTLGPEENLNGNKLFPPGYRSIVHPYWTYLLKLDNSQSCFTSNQVAQQLGKDQSKFARQYDNGAIFCKRPVRRLEIFSFGQSYSNNRMMTLELWQNGNMISSVNLQYFQIGDDIKKQGYSATVVPGLDHQYKLSLAGGGSVPSDWIIEFSDPIFGNRWQRDEIDLVVVGRDCPKPVHSQHDRRFIWSGENFLNVKGRGACTKNPDMPIQNCRNQPKLSNVESCPGKCNKNCTNGYCDCATGECLCNPGFSGLNCEKDICASAGCVNGYCADRYLGGDLSSSLNKCVCKDGWYGEKCDSKVSDSIDNNWQPNLSICDGKCNGTYPYGCNPSFSLGYCNKNGGCSYQLMSDPSWCCFNCPTSMTTANPSTQVTVTAVTAAQTTTKASNFNSCDGKCKGSYPYGCNPSFSFGYCNNLGGCFYELTNDPSWCSFKSGTTNSVTQVTNPATPVQTTTKSSSISSCDGKCRGSYPYGCNPSFSFGYCNNSGGCSYDKTNDPSFCCFKGC